MKIDKEVNQLSFDTIYFCDENCLEIDDKFND